MTVFTGWLFLSVGCSIGFVAGSLFTAGVWGFDMPAAERDLSSGPPGQTGSLRGGGAPLNKFSDSAVIEPSTSLAGPRA